MRNWSLILFTLILLLGAEGAHFMTIMNEFLTSSDSSVVAVDLVGLQAYYVVLSDSDSCYPAAAALFVTSVLRQEEAELLNDVS